MGSLHRDVWIIDFLVLVLSNTCLQILIQSPTTNNDPSVNTIYFLISEYTTVSSTNYQKGL